MLIPSHTGASPLHCRHQTVSAAEVSLGAKQAMANVRPGSTPSRWIRRACQTPADSQAIHRGAFLPRAARQHAPLDRGRRQGVAPAPEGEGGSRGAHTGRRFGSRPPSCLGLTCARHTYTPAASPGAQQSPLRVHQGLGRPTRTVGRRSPCPLSALGPGREGPLPSQHPRTGKSAEPLAKRHPKGPPRQGPLMARHSGRARPGAGESGANRGNHADTTRTWHILQPARPAGRHRRRTCSTFRYTARTPGPTDAAPIERPALGSVHGRKCDRRHRAHHAGAQPADRLAMPTPTPELKRPRKSPHRPPRAAHDRGPAQPPGQGTPPDPGPLGMGHTTAGTSRNMPMASGTASEPARLAKSRPKQTPKTEAGQPTDAERHLAAGWRSRPRGPSIREAGRGPHGHGPGPPGQDPRRSGHPGVLVRWAPALPEGVGTGAWSVARESRSPGNARDGPLRATAHR
ncbi:hypothetical protein H696_04662 [Fonticula alba]|uniref:Uncharacterized protein n=1 Tax=Fonticula alba TaxID=691883 RepID=A0A058Z6S6_FONAL|nr:hypothetical protein H696_04662 [Fonticula alba]KCV69242.1 hypothetical protein H696_04662 [Fonticula alba]|eukprot:XP_009496813.1 hypothetical protein H696_04662 [Fonticula alba]